MFIEIILTVGYVIFFLWIIGKCRFFSCANIPVKWIATVFILKIICGIFLEIIYTRYYSLGRKADIFKYFDDSAILYNSVFINPKHFFQLLFVMHPSTDYLQPYYQKMQWWEASFNELFFNDARTMIRLNALMRFLSFGYYNVHVVFFNFLSLIGLTALFKVFTKSHDIILFPKKLLFDRLLFTGIFLLPSVLLWGSGVLKETFELFVLGMLLYFFFKTVNEKITRLRLLLFVFFFLVQVIIKFYILAAIIPGLISFYFTIKNNYKRTGLTFLLIHLTYFLILFNLHFITPAINISELISLQYYKYIKFAEEIHSGSLLVKNNIQPNALSILKNSFQSFLFVLIHPHLFESKSIVMLIAAIENLFILLVVVCCLTFGVWRLIGFKELPVNRKALPPVFWLALYFSVIIFTLIGLTTPVLGTVVRYKVPALPFLMFTMISIYFREQKMKITQP
jgi:hypothetical protein